MAINATSNGVKRELTPSGTFAARCYSMVHIGTITENILGDNKTLNKVRITWELPSEMRVFDEDKGEQPMVISKEYTLSMHEKANLRKDLESWRGKGFTDDQAKNFDITKLLGVPCMLSIIHKTSKAGSEYATISSVTTLPKGMECPDQINETFEFNYEDKFDEKIVESFPDFIKDKIKSSQEYKEKTLPEHVDVAPEPEDDLPF
jgi:hypothetical protein